MNPADASGAPSRSTKTPKFSILATTPATTSPGWSAMRKSFRALEGSGYVTAQTLFRTSEYPNLPTLAEKAGKSGYIKHATVVRKVGGEGTEYSKAVQDVSGPGTALMELDQAAHRAIGVAAALVTTWITLRKGGRR